MTNTVKGAAEGRRLHTPTASLHLPQTSSGQADQLLEGPETKEVRELVAQNSTRWNDVAAWLRRLDLLRDGC